MSDSKPQNNGLANWIANQNKKSNDWNSGVISHENEYIEEYNEDDFFKRVQGEL